MRKRSKPTSHWRNQHKKDFYMEKALIEGWRSRAVYKLQQIHASDRLFRPGIRCVDLGSSPGSWSQFASKLIGSDGRLWAVDQKPMQPIVGVEFILGDFTDSETISFLRSALGDDSIDLVMSDMSPNISGNRAVDQPRAMGLAEDALAFALETLGEGGSFLTKLFQGEGFEEFVGCIKQSFKSVRIIKPRASRPESREVYLLARTYRM
jgi:23S rRNA (uridine2552-2'-O)-methyltransferase